MMEYLKGNYSKVLVGWSVEESKAFWDKLNLNVVLWGEHKGDMINDTLIGANLFQLFQILDAFLQTGIVASGKDQVNILPFVIIHAGA